MFFFKKCYVNTTEEVDVISVIHELNYAIRDSKGPDGLLTAIVPESGAGLVILSPIGELITEFKETIAVFGGEGEEIKVTDKLRREREAGPMIQSAILGRTIHIPFQNGVLLIDPYDEVFLVDFERKGGRREFVVQVISEAPPGEEGREAVQGGRDRG